MKNMFLQARTIRVAILLYPAASDAGAAAYDGNRGQELAVHLGTIP